MAHGKELGVCVVGPLSLVHDPGNVVPDFHRTLWCRERSAFPSPTEPMLRPSHTPGKAPLPCHDSGTRALGRTVLRRFATLPNDAFQVGPASFPKQAGFSRSANSSTYVTTSATLVMVAVVVSVPTLTSLEHCLRCDVPQHPRHPAGPAVPGGREVPGVPRPQARSIASSTVNASLTRPVHGGSAW